MKSVFVWVVVCWLTVLGSGIMLGKKACAADTTGDTWATATVRSYHHDRNKEHVEANWGLGAEYKMSQDWALVGGGYRNSYGDHSNYLGTAWMPVHYGYFHFGVSMGAVTGYDKAVGVFFIPSVAIQNEHVGLNIGIVPSMTDAYTVIGLQLKIRVR